MAVSDRQLRHAAGAGSDSGAGRNPRFRAVIVIALLVWVGVLVAAAIFAFRGEPLGGKNQDRIPVPGPSDQVRGRSGMGVRL